MHVAKNAMDNLTFKNVKSSSVTSFAIKCICLITILYMLSIPYFLFNDNRNPHTKSVEESDYSKISRTSNMSWLVTHVKQQLEGDAVIQKVVTMIKQDVEKGIQAGLEKAMKKEVEKEVEKESTKYFNRENTCIPVGKKDNSSSPIHIFVPHFRDTILTDVFYQNHSNYIVNIVSTQNMKFSENWYRNLQLTQRKLIEDGFDKGHNDVIYMEDDLLDIKSDFLGHTYYYVDYARQNNLGFLSLQATGGCAYSYGTMMFYVEKHFYLKYLKPRCYQDDSQLPVDMCLNGATQDLKLTVIEFNIFNHNNTKKSTHALWDAAPKSSKL
jgi:hypothetical protein